MKNKKIIICSLIASTCFLQLPKIIVNASSSFIYQGYRITLQNNGLITANMLPFSTLNDEDDFDPSIFDLHNSLVLSNLIEYSDSMYTFVSNCVDDLCNLNGNQFEYTLITSTLGGISYVSGVSGASNNLAIFASMIIGPTLYNYLNEDLIEEITHGFWRNPSEIEPIDPIPPIQPILSSLAAINQYIWTNGCTVDANGHLNSSINDVNNSLYLLTHAIVNSGVATLSLDDCNSLYTPISSQGQQNISASVTYSVTGVSSTIN